MNKVLIHLHRFKNGKQQYMCRNFGIRKEKKSYFKHQNIEDSGRFYIDHSNVLFHCHNAEKHRQCEKRGEKVT